jgi:hypothetical protein
MRRALLAVLGCFSAIALVAAPAAATHIERDLGLGLHYVRIHTLPGDLPVKEVKPRSIVVDLRFTSTDHKGVEALSAWLQFHATAKLPVYVLVNGATSRPLLDYLESAPVMPSVTTVGPASSAYVPDIAVKVSAATEKSAYDALEAGTTVESLLMDQPGKIRYDEQAIAEEHAAANNPDQNDAVPGPPETDTKPPPPPPLIDATLQRAVHLHRALLALHRI